MLIKGKAKDLLEDSINNALLAVEIYNKPKLGNRIKSYIVHMNIAWTKAFLHIFIKQLVKNIFIRIQAVNIKELMVKNVLGN